MIEQAPHNRSHCGLIMNTVPGKSLPGRHRQKSTSGWRVGMENRQIVAQESD
ncbi:MAG: hypothetical protein GY820_15905 [Gammaproteobacteria bacterium]|nr:hypothetical protein [Gammaproteobacteria bacterium]